MTHQTDIIVITVDHVSQTMLDVAVTLQDGREEWHLCEAAYGCAEAARRVLTIALGLDHDEIDPSELQLMSSSGTRDIYELNL